MGVEEDEKQANVYGLQFVKHVDNCRKCLRARHKLFMCQVGRILLNKHEAHSQKMDLVKKVYKRIEIEIPE